MSNKILVLGATGNIGSQIVRILKEHGVDFAGAVPAKELAKLERIGAAGVTVDFDDYSSLERAMNGVQTLFMLLPLEKPMVGWAENIINAAKAAGAGFIVRSSLIDAHPDSEYLLYRIHGQIDDMLRRSGIPCAIVHPNSFMENYVAYYREPIVNNDALYFSVGDAKLSPVDVRDIASVDAEILMHPDKYRGMEFNLTGPDALSQYEIADILSGTLGRKITYYPLPPDRFEKNLHDMGMSDWDVEVTMSLERHIRDGRSSLITRDVTKVTGRDPIPFRQFAKDFAAQWAKAPVYA